MPATVTTAQASAILLQGRLWDFRQHYAGQFDTARTAPDEDGSDAEASFLAAAHDFVTGNAAGAAAAFTHLAGGSATADLRAAAAIVASILLSDLDQRERVLDVIEAARSGPLETQDPLVNAALDLHVGWRMAERGEWASAVRISERVAAALEPPGGLLATIIALVARHNAWNFRWRTDEGPGELPPADAAHLAPLAHQARARAMAYAELVEEQVSEAFARPGGGGIKWSAEDTVDRNLWSATFGAECVADFGGIRRSRTELGRARLLRAAKSRQSPPSDAFRLLLEGGDHKQLSRIASWFAQRGPLESVAAETNRAAVSPWVPMYEETTLALLKVAGDLLEPLRLDSVVSRLLNRSTGSGHDFGIALAALEALPRTVAGAEKRWHAAVADRLLETLSPGAPLLPFLRAPLQAIRWEDVGDVTRDRWKDFAEAAAITGGDAAPAAVAVVLEHAELDVSWALQVATHAYEQRHELLWAWVLMNLDIELPGAVIAAVAQQATAGTLNELVQARSGRYEMGGVDAPVVLAAALARTFDEAGRDALLQYFSDAATSLDTKARVADVAASTWPWPGDDSPRLVAEAISDGLVGHSPFGGAETRADAAWLRLMTRVSGITPHRALDVLLQIVTSAEVGVRIQGARLLPALGDLLGDTVLDVCLWLTRGDHHEVRAAAAASAVSLLAADPPETAVTRLLRDQLRIALADPGVAVPLAVLWRLRSDNAPSMEWLADGVLAVGAEHPSALVRYAAREA